MTIQGPFQDALTLSLSRRERDEKALLPAGEGWG